MPLKKRKPITSVVISRDEQIAQRGLDITDQAANLVGRSSALRHVDLSVEQSLVSFRDVLKAGMAEVHSAYDDIVDKAKAAYDSAKEKRAKYLAPWEAADYKIRLSLNNYYSMIKDQARIAQEQADREQAEHERQALVNQEHERQRLEAEITRQIDSLPSAISEDDETVQRRIVNKLLEPLEQFKNQISVAPPITVSAPELSGGAVQADNWKCQVVEGKELDVLKQIIAGELPLSIVKFHEPGLNRLAKVHQLKRKFDGLRFWNATFVRGVGR